MAEGKKSFVLYANYIDLLDGYDEDGEHIDGMTDEEAGKWIKTIFRYVNDLNPTIPNEIKQAFILVRKDLKQDLKKYQAKVISMENARKSNRNHIENKLKTISNQLEINSDNDNDNVNDNDNDICVNTHNNICACESLKNLITEIEKLIGRSLTNAEYITIEDFTNTMSEESILRDIKAYSDKASPIAYMKKAIEKAHIDSQAMPLEDKGGSEWLDGFNKQWK